MYLCEQIYLFIFCRTLNALFKWYLINDFFLILHTHIHVEIDMYLQNCFSHINAAVIRTQIE